MRGGGEPPQPTALTQTGDGSSAVATPPGAQACLPLHRPCTTLPLPEFGEGASVHHQPPQDYPGRGRTIPLCDPLRRRAPPSARRGPSWSTTTAAASALRRPSSSSAGRADAFNCSPSPKFRAPDSWLNSTRPKSQAQPISLRRKGWNITAAPPPRARSGCCPSEASLPSWTCPAFPSCEMLATPGSAPTEASSQALPSASHPEEARRRI
jgi:hypothetical protein